MLEAEIINLENQANKRFALNTEIETATAKLRKQIETLGNLKKALGIQLENA